MAKDDPKKNAKKAKSEPDKESSKNDWKEQTKPESGGTDSNQGGCSSVAKVLIYIIPLALYIPWAYRMFKGNACCPEMPKCPTAPMSKSCSASGNTSIGTPFSRLGQRIRAPKGEQQSSCCESQNGGEDEQSCDSGMSKAVNFDKEREECLDQSKQCLEKCMEKCFDADRAEEKEKKKKRKKRKEKTCDEDED